MFKPPDDTIPLVTKVYCSVLGAHAVHVAMAGYTGIVVGKVDERCWAFSLWQLVDSFMSTIWGFPYMELPPGRWMVDFMENPVKVDD